MADVTNPDLVDVADQAFGQGVPSQVPNFKVIPASASEVNRSGAGGHRPFVVDQEILVGPSQTSGVPADGDDPSQVKPVPSASNQPVVVGPSQNPGPTIAGGSASPTSSRVRDVSHDRIADQVFGNGPPINVYP